MCTEEEKQEDLKKVPTDSILEAFTTIESRHIHIYEMLRYLWGSYVCDRYLEVLLTDTRKGARRGFEPSILECLVKIANSHAKSPYRDKIRVYGAKD